MGVVGMEPLEAVVGALAVLALAGATFAMVAVVLVVRLTRAVLERASAAVDRARLRTRARGLGAAGELARLRLELDSSLVGVRRVLARAQALSWPVGDAPALVRRLERSAAGVAAELEALGFETDPVRRGAALAQVRGRVALVTRSCAALRSALLEGSLRTTEDELAGLGADCAIEARALRARPAAPLL